jgi:elongation factor Ts
MANITAAEVKKLRDATGAGMMECKKALTEADGDFDKAVEILRISGAAKAAKRADRSASNGLVANSGGTVIELLCETDFVAKNDQFQQLASRIAEAADAARPADSEALQALVLDSGKTVAEEVAALGAVIGEKLAAGRVAHLDGDVTVYLHRRSADLPPAVGVIVSYTGNEEAARGAAMQVAAMRPKYLTRDEIPADVLDSERRIAEATAREEGKPEQALPKIIEGRVNAFVKDATLLEQPSVVESKKSVAAVLKDSGAEVTGFARIEVGAQA